MFNLLARFVCEKRLGASAFLGNDLDEALTGLAHPRWELSVESVVTDKRGETEEIRTVSLGTSGWRNEGGARGLSHRA